MTPSVIHRIATRLAAARNNAWRFGVGSLVAYSALMGGVAQAETLVPNTSTWRWLHPTDGVDPAKADEDFHSTFYAADFDDSKWNEGKDQPGATGGFGYGEVGESGAALKGVDIGLPESENRRNAYFRLKFTTKKDFDKLVLKCQRDDGIIVYLDGKEVVRDNVDAEKKDTFELDANTTVGGDDEKRLNTFPLKTKLLAGEHILAISLHNRGRESSDLRLAEVSLATAEPAKVD